MATSVGRVGGQPEATQAQIRHRAQIRRFQLVGLHHRAAGRGELRLVIRHGHRVNARRIGQTLEMILQAKNHRPTLRLVAADALEYRRAIVQRVRHHVRGGLGPRLDRAVVPDELGIGLRHDELRLGNAT